jgi:uncharacterized membrane protein
MYVLEGLVRWAFVFEGLLFCALGIPLALRKIPPNSLYGFRTPKTLSRPDVWYAANHSMGVDLTIAGAIIAVAAVINAIVFRDRPLRDLSLLNVAITAIVLVIVAIKGFVQLRQL